jgi:hypothetical protein
MLDPADKDVGQRKCLTCKRRSFQSRRYSISNSIKNILIYATSENTHVGVSTVLGFSLSLFAWEAPLILTNSYLVDSASSHMLVSKIKPCMSKYKQLLL